MPAARLCDWSVHASPAALAEALADRVATALSEAIATRGAATLAVSGGTTPVRFFAALATRDIDWPRVTVTLVDERFVPPASPRSNERLVRENLLKGKAEAAGFVPFVVPDAPPPLAPPLKGEGNSEALAPPSPLRGGVRGGGETPVPFPEQDAGTTSASTPEAAAHAASEILQTLPFPFDVVVLGMGTDGHTASFFPDAEGLETLLDPAAGSLVLPVHAQSAGELRLTLSLPAIATARMLVVHIEGEAKRQAFEAAFGDEALPPKPIRTVIEAARTRPTIFWAPSEGAKP